MLCYTCTYLEKYIFTYLCIYIFIYLHIYIFMILGLILKLFVFFTIMWCLLFTQVINWSKWLYIFIYIYTQKYTQTLHFLIAYTKNFRSGCSLFPRNYKALRRGMYHSKITSGKGVETPWDISNYIFVWDKRIKICSVI